ncbi:MAG: hypothetical protein OWT27_02885, partial [Firmicutes bacterium]|nr:hypothetical protein [Bacillota bacterium]
HIVEDMALARAIKSSGRNTVLCNLTGYLTVAMYDRARDVWHGFAKNAYAGIGRRVSVLASIALFYAWMYILPVATLAGLIGAALAGRRSPAEMWLLASLGAALGPCIKRLVDRRFAVPPWVSLMMAGSALLLIGILMYSAGLSWLRVGYTWKGRRYR